MILYFSATGNCKYVAARLEKAETQVALPSWIASAKTASHLKMKPSA